MEDVIGNDGSSADADTQRGAAESGSRLPGSGHFRKKPVVIEAVRVNAADYNGRDWDGFPFDGSPDWLMEALRTEAITVEPSDTDYALWRIATLEDGPSGQAKHIAEPGDYIIRGVKGELYPCKPDIFAATYEATTPASQAPSEDEGLQAGVNHNDQ